jgi:hypothetical protein
LDAWHGRLVPYREVQAMVAFFIETGMTGFHGRACSGKPAWR